MAPMPGWPGGGVGRRYGIQLAVSLPCSNSLVFIRGSREAAPIGDEFLKNGEEKKEMGKKQSHGIV